MNVKVNGGKATLEDFVAVARSGDKVFLSPLAHKKILRSRRAVEGAVNAGKVIYGIRKI